MLDYNLYKNVILEVIEKIENSLVGVSTKEFLKDPEIQDATLMRLQVIGENIKNLSLKIKKKNKDIKWKKFEKLRDIISHKYQSIDYLLIWSFLETNLKELKQTIQNLEEEA